MAWCLIKHRGNIILQKSGIKSLNLETFTFGNLVLSHSVHFTHKKIHVINFIESLPIVFRRVTLIRNLKKFSMNNSEYSFPKA